MKKSIVVVHYSKEESDKKFSQVEVNGTLKIKTNNYTSSWVVADCRYDVLLGMLWHVANNPSIALVNLVVQVCDEKILAGRKSLSVINKRVTVNNMSVKLFCSFLKKPFSNVQVFQVFSKKNKKANELKKVKTNKQVSRNDELLKKSTRAHFGPSYRIACYLCGRWSMKSVSRMGQSHLTSHCTNCLLRSCKQQKTMSKFFWRRGRLEAANRRALHHCSLWRIRTSCAELLTTELWVSSRRRSMRIFSNR